MPVDTIPALFLHAVKTHNKRSAFQYKSEGHYKDVSHQEMLEAVDQVSRGLHTLGIAKGDRVAILSENRLEWAITDLAVLSAGAIVVPVYATLPGQQVEYILSDCEARAVFVSSQEQLDKIQALRTNLPNLRHVFVFDSASVGADMLFEELRESGARATSTEEFAKRIATIGKYDWSSIIYTSGTTGAPKGVILNHWNFVSNVMSVTSLFDMSAKDRCLSFLPLSHVFERTGGYYMMMHLGVTIAYAEGIDSVPKNLLEVSPTVMVSVPRLYEKMYARIMDAATSGPALKRALFFWAVRVGKTYLREKMEKRIKRSTAMHHRLADRLVFSKLRARTGGRLRFFVSGGAPLSREIAEFFFAAGLPILEGYGLTETSPVISVNTLNHFKFGSVGRPIPNVHVQIADDGEILAKGPNIMLGYYKKPEVTREVLDGEWFHTGDIGHIDDDGYLVITDRKKDIIVTAGGKNVAPQPIENLFKTNKYIAEAVVIGNRRKFIAAVIVPNFDNLWAFARAAKLVAETNTDLVHHPKTVEKYHQEINDISEHLASFERVKKFLLLEKEFSIEAGEVTPTLKVKRSAIEKKYQKEIDALYDMD